MTLRSLLLIPESLFPGSAGKTRVAGGLCPSARADHSRPAPVIIGVSFGGMLAEIVKSKIRPPGTHPDFQQQDGEEFPSSYWRVGKYIPLYRWLPGAMAGWLAG